MALSLTWGGRADTNVALTEFFGADHTVAVRFMIQFANIYEGPMLAVHGSGTYFIGCGDGSAGNNKITIRIGSGSLELPIAQTFQGSWHHVAVVRSGTIGTVYLDGASKGTLALPASGQPSGTLRMGRSDQIHQQFYGFLDDVAIFKAALTAAQVSALASANTLTGNETNLLAGYVFGDGPTAALPATLTRPVTLVPGAHYVNVSPNRNNAADRGLLPLSLVSHMRLPFAQGQIASIVQGFANPTVSHSGYAAFCFDFVFPNGDINGYVFKAASPLPAPEYGASTRRDRARFRVGRTPWIAIPLPCSSPARPATSARGCCPSCAIAATPSAPWLAIRRPSGSRRASTRGRATRSPARGCPRRSKGAGRRTT